jgi:hypothetical protein
VIALGDWVLWATHHAQALAPSPSPSPTPTLAVTVVVTPSPSTSGTNSNGGTTAVQVWTLVVAGLAVVGSVLSIFFVRKTGRETTAAAQKSADAADLSSKAADRAAAELQVWRQREETMRMLRWAIENAIKPDPAASNAGQITLEIVKGIIAHLQAPTEEADEIVVVDARPGENVPRPAEWEQ